MDTTTDTTLRYSVDDLQACEPESLPTERADANGILVELHSELDSMGFHRVTVSAYTEAALLDFIAEHWGTEDAEWYREHVAEAVEVYPTEALDDEVRAKLAPAPADPMALARAEAAKRPTSNLLGLIQRDLRGRLMFTRDDDGTRETVTMKVADVRNLLAAVEEIRDRLS